MQIVPLAAESILKTAVFDNDAFGWFEQLFAGEVEYGGFFAVDSEQAVVDERNLHEASRNDDAVSRVFDADNGNFRIVAFGRKGFERCPFDRNYFRLKIVTSCDSCGKKDCNQNLFHESVGFK